MARNRHAIYVGWDSQQPSAYEVCRHSLLRHAANAPDVMPLHQQELRERTLYWRKEDPLASTEFTYTRFLVPHLARYEGWALFMDSDFLVTADIDDLFAHADERYALLCVQHDYRPSETVKMDGQVQTSYPRKNWSSLVLWNCGHPANRVVTPEIVNRETGAFLHRFQWLDDGLIGALPATWNWLEGWNEKLADGVPKGIHYTRGGPWYENWGDVDYADLWREELAMLRRSEPTASAASLPGATSPGATFTGTASHAAR